MCGFYHCSRTFESIAKNPDEGGELGPKGSRRRANLSAWVRSVSELSDWRRQQQNAPMLSSYFFGDEEGGYKDSLGEQFRATPEPTFTEKADKLLLALRDATSFAGDEVKWNQDILKYMSLSWSLNFDEFAYILNFLTERGMIVGGVKLGRSSDKALALPTWITPAGLARIEELDQKHPDSKQGFIAMWFGEEVGESLHPAIRSSIEAAGYDPHRVDDGDYIGRIDNKIMVEIKRSRFIVADFTEQRGGVYFEAGFAMGLAIPVIWTCHKDHVENLHFDIRQYNCLVWDEENLDDFKDKLTARIENVIGHGPNKPN